MNLTGIEYPEIYPGDTAEGFVVIADSVVIRGFQISDVARSYLKDRAGIRINDCRHCLIENNRLIRTFLGSTLRMHGAASSVTMKSRVFQGMKHLRKCHTSLVLKGYNG